MSDLNSSLETLFSKMENFISTKTVVGDPVTVGDIILLPLIDVSFGVGAGSKGASKDKGDNDTSGGGLGAKITPSAVLVVQKGTVQMVSIKNQTSVDKLLDMVPGVINKFDLNSMFKPKDKKDEEDN